MASSAPQNLYAVFVYGSLLADDVVVALLNRVPHSSAAVVHNLSVSPFIRPLVSQLSILILVFSSCNFASNIAVLSDWLLRIRKERVRKENRIVDMIFSFRVMSYT